MQRNEEHATRTAHTHTQDGMLKIQFKSFLIDPKRSITLLCTVHGNRFINLLLLLRRQGSNSHFRKFVVCQFRTQRIQYG